MKDNSIYTQEFYKKLIDNISDGVYFVDRDRKITYWNKGAVEITGYQPDEVLGYCCSDNILNHIDNDGQELCLNHCPLSKTMEDGQSRQAQVFLHHKNGHRVPIIVRISPIYNEESKIIGAVEMFTDVTSQMEVLERLKTLEKEAYIDTLTELPNRSFLEKNLQSLYDNFTRYQWPFGVIFFDIDHFKHFNDTYGHDVGDNILRLVSHTFRHNARSFDTIGRWGGEEFLGVIPNVDIETLAQFANRLRILVAEAHLFHHKQKLNVTISGGATTIQTDDTIESVIKRADKYLYESKNNGRNQITCR